MFHAICWIVSENWFQKTRNFKKINMNFSYLVLQYVLANKPTLCLGWTRKVKKLRPKNTWSSFLELNEEYNVKKCLIIVSKMYISKHCK